MLEFNFRKRDELWFEKHKTQTKICVGAGVLTLLGYWLACIVFTF